ncbi:MAG: rhodanese-like domain-containing protein [Bacteroidetes bacterium]|nr:rhodanese-like domain-containing protein [Bacteroidota bacterium]MBU1580295.1 rhodanese-like domain-containing protein [Bacteroidota bacterium]MBU2465979.1 rhodanese-like domain-containing protein [Bacteroidota bacterium]MBU2556545.1 rhodanese-like domain-containing protein [Bacteroidota bacterium]
MKKIILLLAVFFSLNACDKKQDYSSAEAMVDAAKQNVTLITADDLYELMNGEEIYTLIDVRQEIENYYGYIPGSVNIPRGSLEFQIGKQEYWDNAGLYMPEKGEIIVLYCKKGDRGVLATETLSKMGYTNVKALDGGWKEWEVSYPDLYEKNLEKLGGHSSEPASSGGC